MTDYQTFNKNRLFILLPTGQKDDIPAYVSSAKKRYRFDSDDKILSKQCSACERWFPVSQYSEGKWIDIRQEHIKHYRSGYSSYCVDCTPVAPSKAAITKTGSADHPKDKDTSDDISSHTKPEKYSVFLSDSHKRYLRLRAAGQSRTIKQVLSEIIEREIAENPVKKYL